MPQTLINISGIGGKADAEKLVDAGEALNGVKLINVNVNDGRVVITHEAGFDVETFKQVATNLGFSA